MCNDKNGVLFLYRKDIVCMYTGNIEMNYKHGIGK